MNEVSIVLGFALLMLTLTACTAVLLCVWVYRDAKLRGLEAWVWTLVVLLTSGVGLILYFLVGRKEARVSCPSCGKSIPASCAYCGYCGGAVPSKELPSGVSRGPLIGAVTCLVLSFVLGVGFVVFTVAGSGVGWKPTVSTIYIQNSRGSHWNVSWHYINKTSTRSFQLTEDGPNTLYFEGSCGEGPLILRVWQGEVERTFDLSGEGMAGSLDLDLFEPGTVYLALENGDGAGKNVTFESHWE